MEHHGLMDGRLFICTIAVAFAMFALVWDYFKPFPESRPILILCVTSYPLQMIEKVKVSFYVESGKDFLADYSSIFMIFYLSTPARNLCISSEYWY